MIQEQELDRPPILQRIEDPQELLAQIVDCIEKEDSRGLKTYILEHKLRDESLYWELILKIGEKISAKVCEDNPVFFDTCNRCLAYLVKMGKPKEMLLAVLEQMDTFIDDVKYKCFLPPLQLSLSKISSKLFHSLDITLETVSAHIRGLTTPENTNLEGDERKLYHLDSVVVRITDNVEAFLNFLDPFVNSVKLSGKGLSDSKKHEALVLKKHLIRLFDFPFNCLDLTEDPDKSKPKTNSRLCVEKAMELLSHVETNFQRLISSADVTPVQPVREGDDEKGDESDSREEGNYDNPLNEKKQKAIDESNAYNEDNDFVENWDFQLEITKEAQACLAYIIHVEHLGVHKYPQIFSYEFLFQYNLPAISLMLKNTFYPINYKGLLLCKAFTDLINQEAYVAYCLDDPHFIILLNDLIFVMTKCPVRDHRTLATPLFTSIIKKFQAGGRYQIFQNILSTCDHSGVKGYIITILKDDISNFIKQRKTSLSDSVHASTTATQEVISPFFGNKLKRLIFLVIKLPDKETTDMLQNADQIISTINFLRFVVVADPSHVNITGLWNYLSDIDTQFLAPLRLGLDISLAHYKLELNNILAGKATEDAGGNEMEFNVSAGGMNVPKMEKGQKINFFQQALNAHELMISLLCRLTELIDQNS